MPFLSTFGAASARSRGLRGRSPLGGQALYTAEGNYTWVCPAGVTSISVVVIGCGGVGAGNGWGGGGGGLAYKNNIAVTPGTSYSLRVGGPGSNYFTPDYSNFNSQIYAKSGGWGVGIGTYGSNAGGDSSGGDVNRSGGSGGVGGRGSGGGGAAGYTGNGGAGADGDGASGGGGGGGIGVYGFTGSSLIPGGGGVGDVFVNGSGVGGSAGSGGIAGTSSRIVGSTSFGGAGGGFGGGGGSSAGTPILGGADGIGGGAVRIIWAFAGNGITRAFPSTNTQDL